VVSEGGIVEEGPHAALLARDGAYRRLHDAQIGAAERTLTEFPRPAARGGT
jgi:ATP-binding cassette subfamily B protein